MVQEMLEAKKERHRTMFAPSWLWKEESDAVVLWAWALAVKQWKGLIISVVARTVGNPWMAHLVSQARLLVND